MLTFHVYSVPNVFLENMIFDCKYIKADILFVLYRFLKSIIFFTLISQVWIYRLYSQINFTIAAILLNVENRVRIMFG